MDCPVCEKKGIADYTQKEIICPQCDSDLSSYKYIHDLKSDQGDRKIFTPLSIIILLLVIAISAFLVNSEKRTKSELDSTIIELQGQLNDQSLKVKDLQSSVEVLKDSLFSPRFMTYVIQKGDSPWVVSKRFYGTPLKFRVIQEDNNLIENSKFHPGRTLKIRIE